MSKNLPAPTDKERNTICLWLKKGVHISSVLKHCGIPQKLFDHWLRLGAQGEQPYKNFGECIDDALITFELGLLNFIADKAAHQAAAAQWLFMLRFGQKYKAIAELETKAWLAENGHVEHASSTKPLSAKEIEAIEHKALAMDNKDPTQPAPRLSDLELAKLGKFGLQ